MPHIPSRFSPLRKLLIACTLLLVASLPGISTAQTNSPQSPEVINAEFDIVIYGGTSAGLAAAVGAKRLGKTVAVVSPDVHLGGLTAGGLGWTDTGNKAVIGGIAREFYQEIWKHYQQDAAWNWQPRSEYGNRGQGNKAIDGDARTMWIFEPKVAEQVYEAWVRKYDIPVYRNQWLNRKDGLTKVGDRITEIRTLSGSAFRAKMFIDATYEGDLMALAGVGFHVGRESNATYDETYNGVQTDEFHHSHYFRTPISPYKTPGDPTSGLLPRISAEPPGAKGEGDHRIQAYCYRMCLTNHDPNRVPFPKPDDYDPAQYELLLRVLLAEWREVFNKFDPIPNYKTDTNNHGPFSTDNIGMNYDYPEGSYARREEILAEHRSYQQGMMYFLANDPRVPDDVRLEFAKWGLAKDEFVDSGNWPHQIYVRESRRMIGQYVMTEHDCLSRKETPQPVGMGSYTLDSHNTQRYVTPDGFVQNEGDLGIKTPRPYQISYGSLIPRSGECGNLLVPVCVSSSHIAFGSIRMEPVFMILGHSAAAAASIAIDSRVPVQKVPYSMLERQLLIDGQVLESDEPAVVLPKNYPGTVVDDSQAKRTGVWLPSSANKPFVGTGYMHDGHAANGKSIAEFSAKLVPGRYRVRMSFSAGGNRASNTPVTVSHQNGVEKATVNQRRAKLEDDVWFELGQFDFDETAKVTVSNAGTDGHVIIDAVQWLPVESQ